MDPRGALVAAALSLAGGGWWLLLGHLKRVDPGDRLEALRKRQGLAGGRLFVMLGLVYLVLYGVWMLVGVVVLHMDPIGLLAAAGSFLFNGGVLLVATRHKPISPEATLDA